MAMYKKVTFRYSFVAVLSHSQLSLNTPSKAAGWLRHLTQKIKSKQLWSHINCFHVKSSSCPTTKKIDVKGCGKTINSLVAMAQVFGCRPVVDLPVFNRHCGLHSQKDWSPTSHPIRPSSKSHFEIQLGCLIVKPKPVLPNLLDTPRSIYKEKT